MRAIHPFVYFKCWKFVQFRISIHKWIDNLVGLRPTDWQISYLLFYCLIENTGQATAAYFLNFCHNLLCFLNICNISIIFERLSQLLPRILGFALNSSTYDTLTQLFSLFKLGIPITYWVKHCCHETGVKVTLLITR